MYACGLATSFSGVSLWQQDGYQLFQDCILPSYHAAAFPEFQKSPTIILNLPHMGHMPILEPVSMANGMESVDWPELGHGLHPSLPTWQPGLGQTYTNHMDSERW